MRCKCPLSGVKRTLVPHRKMSANHPKRTVHIRPPSNSIAAGLTFIVACEIIDKGGIGHNQPSGSAAGLCRKLWSKS